MPQADSKTSNPFFVPSSEQNRRIRSLPVSPKLQIIKWQTIPYQANVLAGHT
jgi:hypothetical protein